MQNVISLSRIVTKICLLLTTIFLHCGGPAQPVTLFSPDGTIEVHIATTPPDGSTQLSYGVLRNGTALIGPAPLSLELQGGVTLGGNLTITGVSHEEVNELWHSKLEKFSEITNRYNAATVTLVDSDGRTFDLIFRAYDDGVAFRYHFPEQPNLDVLALVAEKSAFIFRGDPEYWGLHANSYISNYEFNYTQSRLSAIPSEDIIGLPILLHTAAGTWVAVTEADLTDYAGMYVQNAGGRLVSSLAPRQDDSGLCVKASLPHDSPWRVMMIADDPGKLIESNIVANLNDPAAIDDSWIKPGRSAWDWWNGPTLKNVDFEVGMNNATFETFIDFAGESGLEYMMIDAGWYGDHRDESADVTRSISEIDIPHLVSYAKARGVDILLWLNWEPLNKRMDGALAMYKSWDVKGIKVDYMDSDDQETVNFYHRLVKKAAAHQLTVDYHGAYKPTGWRRTYPNLITREGVLGLEHLKWSTNAHPSHNCTVPFTRMLAGPLDYTPGGFLNVRPDQFESRYPEPLTLTTRAHQLALFVIFESPVQVLADYPSAYRNQPGFEFLQMVPTVWNEIKVLQGDVGQYIAIARRHGDDWYIGGITNEQARTMDISLGFLGAGNWQAQIFTDGPDAVQNPKDVAISTQQVMGGQSLKMELAPGGGVAIKLSRVQ
jgi:alpha-glucosidase